MEADLATAPDIFVSLFIFLGLYRATNWVIKPNIVLVTKIRNMCLLEFGPRSASHNFAKFKAYVIN